MATLMMTPEYAPSSDSLSADLDLLIEKSLPGTFSSDRFIAFLKRVCAAVVAQVDSTGSSTGSLSGASTGVGGASGGVSAVGVMSVEARSCLQAAFADVFGKVASGAAAVDALYHAELPKLLNLIEFLLAVPALAALFLSLNLVDDSEVASARTLLHGFFGHPLGAPTPPRGIAAAAGIGGAAAGIGGGATGFAAEGIAHLGAGVPGLGGAQQNRPTAYLFEKKPLGLLLRLSCLPANEYGPFQYFDSHVRNVDIRELEATEQHIYTVCHHISHILFNLQFGLSNIYLYTYNRSDSRGSSSRGGASGARRGPKRFQFFKDFLSTNFK